MKKHIKYIIGGLALTLSLSACMKDLDQDPIDPDSFTERDVFKDANEAKSALAKIYSSMAVTGQQGPSGDGDLANTDEGSSQYTRMQFYAQEISTDTGVLVWSDAGAPDFHAMNWTSANQYLTNLYNRLGQQIAFANSFVDNAQTLASNQEVQHYIAEARFLRAYAYYNLIDLFGNVPLVTSSQGNLKPAQSTRAELFSFVETELKELESLLPASNEYGRVDVVAAQALLSRLYLNAEVFVGTNRYTDCITYANKVIASSYRLHSDYAQLFMADNDTNGAQNEFIFAVNFDGLNTKAYGGTSFIIHAATGGSMNPNLVGVNGGWAGLTVTNQFVDKFEVATRNSDNEPITWNDKRAMFYTDGQTYQTQNTTQFVNAGYAVTKFKNLTTAGAAGKDNEGNFADTDLPIIRLAEIYLNYAEAVLRGGSGGDRPTALGYINQLRTRAAASNITDGQLTLDFILDERARELYWEGLRRTDLIRYNRFTTGSYLWNFKAGVASGAASADYRNLYPIPYTVLSANENLRQNTGY